MDPVSALVIGGAVAGAAGRVYEGHSAAAAMRSQADADVARADTNAAWAHRRSLEELAAGQGQAVAAQREASLARSRLGAVAGASGSGASDPTVLDLETGIAREGEYNAAAAQAAARQKASGIDYQAALERWSADANARIKRQAAKATIIGGYLGASGMIGSAMAQRYASGKAAPAGATGYGG